MAMLAELVDGVIGVDTHHRHPDRGRRHPPWWRAGPDHHQRRCRRLSAAAGLCPRAPARPSLRPGLLRMGRLASGAAVGCVSRWVQSQARP
jgi:hypothetical protein